MEHQKLLVQQCTLRGRSRSVHANTEVSLRQNTDNDVIEVSVRNMLKTARHFERVAVPKPAVTL